MSEWISVEDRLPEESGEYLFYQTPDERNFHQQVVWFDTIQGFSNNYTVHFWKPLDPDPLPAPPKEGE